ncbi:MAG: methionyl-tRNA formyltransferase [Leptospirales bacterium]|nr:methionyl-tRNA formyltransferase [Leptospirales bacterium]
MGSLKVAFFGSPSISAELLAALLDSSQHRVVCVFSNPDRPRGRSSQLQATPVSLLAQQQGIPLSRSEKPGGREDLALLRQSGADIGVVFAYGQLIPMSMVHSLPAGMVNLHASLLPELRGASPIQSAIWRGMTHTGWSLQKLARELDSGEIIAQRSMDVDPEETAGELTARMLPEGIRLTLSALDDFQALASLATAQEHSKASYCRKIGPREAIIDWRENALQIHNQVRALNPAPAARTSLDGGLVKVWRTRISPDGPEELQALNCGEGLASKQRLWVRCGKDLLEILELQAEGRRRQQAGEFVNGLRLPAPYKFGNG